MDTLGSKVKALRKKQKMTQQALAQGLVTPSMISQIESDRATPSAVLLEQLAQRLNVPLSFFQSDLLDKSDELQNYRHARNLIEAHKFEEALNLLKSLSWPLSPQFKPEIVYAEMATCYTQLGQYESACSMFESVIQVGYEREDVAITVHGYFNAGSTFRRLGKDKVARMYWQRASELLGQHPDIYMPISLKIHFNLGRLFLEEGNWNASRRAYEKALSLSNQNGGNLDFAKTYQGLSWACMKLSDFSMALTYNERAIAAHIAADQQKGTFRCQINHGVILRHAMRYVEAYQHFCSIRSKLPDRSSILDLAVRHEITLLSFHLAYFNEVLEESKAALEHPKLTNDLELELRLIRAKSFLALGDTEQAMNEVEFSRKVMVSENLSDYFVAFTDIERKCRLAMGHEEAVISLCIEEAQKLLPALNIIRRYDISA